MLFGVLHYITLHYILFDPEDSEEPGDIFMYHALLSDRFPHFIFHTTVRDLGVTLDSALTFPHHVSNLTRTCSSYLQMRRLRIIRKAVSVPIFTSIVHAFVCYIQD